MEFEFPKWVIQTANSKKTLNRKTNKMQEDITDDCLFDSPEEANSKLRIMDPGYVVNRRRKVVGLEKSRIW